jgi:tetratricopeptide (TPR) repeat protein
MQQLLYAGEVRSIKELEIPKTEVKDAELKLAQQLIEQQAVAGFDPGAYTDDVRARIEAAVRAYECAVVADPAFLDARVNLGLLLHQSGALAKAERAYREGLAACGSDPLLLYILGVLLEDLKRKPEATEAYRAALCGDPALADCHYDLALLYEDLGKPKDALRHLAQYRRLTRR